MLFGNYYAYDNPAALNTSLQKYLGHSYDDFQYELNLLYSVYSFPNMFLPFLSGRLIDRYDIKKVLIFCSLLVCIGQTVFAYGVGHKSFSIMILGRICFGMGGESISVIQALITTSWFKGKELAFALGLNLCIARFGSVVNAIVSPRMANAYDVPTAVRLGAVTCYASFLSAIALCTIIHFANEEKEEPNNEPEEALFDTTAIFKYPVTYWLLCLICVSLYGTVIPFNNIAQDFLQSKYGLSNESAGVVMSVPDTISAFLVPVSYTHLTLPTT